MLNTFIQNRIFYQIFWMLTISLVWMVLQSTEVLNIYPFSSVFFFHVISCKVFRNIFQIQWIWFYFIALYFKWIAFDTIIRRKAVSLSFYFTVFCFKLLAFYTIIIQKTVGLWFYFKVLYFEVIGFYTITIQKTIGCIVV